MKNKKSQLQMHETIIVLFIFMLLVGMGLIAFNKYMSAKTEEMKQKDLLIEFSFSIGSIPSMAEFQCSKFASQQDGCMDMLKILAFKTLDLESKYNLGFKNVTLFILYPKPEQNKECTFKLLKQGKDCTYVNIYSNVPKGYTAKHVTSTAVLVKFPSQDGVAYKLGKLVVEQYTK